MEGKRTKVQVLRGTKVESGWEWNCIAVCETTHLINAGSIAKFCTMRSKKSGKKSFLIDFE